MKAIILKSSSLAQFHFGKTTLDSGTSLDDTSDICHSDTLWSAFVQNCANISNAHAERFVNWSEQGKLKLSSTLFYLEFEDKIIYFLPKPVSANLIETKSSRRKEAKKIKYLSVKVLEKGIKPNDWFGDDCEIIQDEFVMTKEEIPESIKEIKIYERQSFQKVKVSYAGEKDNLYYQTNIQLCGGNDYKVGYYFLIDSKLNDEDNAIFNKYLELLLSFGLGGELSTGCGQFDGDETKDFEYNIQNVSKYFSCSMCIPLESEIEKCLLYKSEIRGGRYLADGQIAKRIEMLGEGAVFSKKIKGTICNLTPSDYDTPIKRCGIPLLLPLHQNYQYEEVSK